MRSFCPQVGPAYAIISIGFDRDTLSLYQKPEPELEEASNLSGKPSRIILA